MRSDVKVLNQKGVTVALWTVDEEVASRLNPAARFRFGVKRPSFLFSVSILEKPCWKVQQLPDALTEDKLACWGRFFTIGVLCGTLA